MTRLPANHELERQALAAAMIDPASFDHLMDLPGGSFNNPAMSDLHAIMVDLRTAGHPVDDHAMILQRAAELNRAQFVDVNLIAGVMSTEASAYYAGHYAAQLRDLHARRETIRAAHQLIHHASEGDLPADDLATLASQVGSPLDTRARHTFVSQAQAVDEALRDAESEAPNAISTGYKDLDLQILGFEPGALYVLAARPAMGKSALGYSFILKGARAGHHGAVASLEMPGKALALRALATEASVDLNRIRQKTLGGPERTRLRAARDRIRDLPITYMDATDQTGASIARDARKLRAAGKLDLLMVDYLQLIETGKGGSENRQQEISTISRNLKKLAMELQIPVVVLSQLSRAVESRPIKRPMLSDLRESGAIEQDADTVMFIYRDEYYNPKSEQQGVADIIVAKQRNGPVGDVQLSYSSEFVRFGNLSRYEEVSA